MDSTAFQARAVQLLSVLSNDARVSEGMPCPVTFGEGHVRMGTAPGWSVWVAWRGFRGVKPQIAPGGPDQTQPPTKRRLHLSLLWQIWCAPNDPVAQIEDLEAQTQIIGANVFRVLMDHLADPLWDKLVPTDGQVGAQDQARFHMCIMTYEMQITEFT